MKHTLVLEKSAWPDAFFEMSKIPTKITYRGTLPPASTKRLAVIGSRNYTPYGKQACQYLLAGLAGHDICIVSGLAYGIDGIAHKSALEVGLSTVAIPGSGIDPSAVYPAAHRNLSEKIIQGGGALMSLFEPEFKGSRWSFPVRNELIAAYCDALLVIEAGAKSGTQITARLALDLGKDILAVPGPITSDTSLGTTNLLRDGATPVSTSAHILQALGMHGAIQDKLALGTPNLPDQEAAIWDLLDNPRDREYLIQKTKFSATTLSISISSLELKGYIYEEYGQIQRKTLGK